MRFQLFRLVLKTLTPLAQIAATVAVLCTIFPVDFWPLTF